MSCSAPWEACSTARSWSFARAASSFSPTRTGCRRSRTHSDRWRSKARHGPVTTMACRPLTFQHSIVITAAPDAVLAAFFDPAALTVWWDTVRSVTIPRPLGVYAIEWRNTPFSDELLGTLGGVFYGTVMEFRPRREFFLADAALLCVDLPGLRRVGSVARGARGAEAASRKRRHAERAGNLAEDPGGRSNLRASPASH